MEGLKEIRASIAIAVKEAVKEGMAQKEFEDPLNTQYLISEAEKCNERLNSTVQPTERTSPDDQPGPLVTPKVTTKDKPHRPTQRKILLIYPVITKEELCKTINHLIQVNQLEEIISKSEDIIENTPKKTEQKFLPAININLDGDEDPQAIERDDDIPLDFTKVKTARKFKDKRPELPVHVNNTVSKELKDHLKEQKNKDTKTRPQEETEMPTKIEKIKDMLNKQSLVIGVAPITKQHLDNDEKKIIKRGVLKDNEPWEEKRQQTIKSVLKSWAYNYLKISDEEWKSIQLEEISLTYSPESDILFMCCKTPADATKITSRARNLPPDPTGQGPRLVMFIDKRARARYRAFQSIAKTLRDKATKNGRKVQTNLPTGRTDFLLRLHQNGDPTQWSDIPPLQITQRLPHFEIGLYKDIYNKSLSSSEEENENGEEMEESQEEMEELDRIQKDMEEKAAEKKRE